MNTMSTFKTKEFRRLHRAWMNKLKQKGFDDIEDLNSPNEWLKTWDSQCFITYAENGDMKYAQVYYQVASDLLNTHDFESDLEREIWRYHAGGYSMREIEQELYTKKNRLNKDKINLIIQRLQKFVGRR